MKIEIPYLQCVQLGTHNEYRYVFEVKYPNVELVQFYLSCITNGHKRLVASWDKDDPKDAGLSPPTPLPEVMKNLMEEILYKMRIVIRKNDRVEKFELRWMPDVGDNMMLKKVRYIPMEKRKKRNEEETK